MNWGLVGILVVLALFIILLIFNPRLSCFGKIIKSPFYPLRRKKIKKKHIEDYGFHLKGEEKK